MRSTTLLLPSMTAVLLAGCLDADLPMGPPADVAARVPLASIGGPARGRLVPWGKTDFGQANVPAGDDFVAVAAGTGHGLALRSDGTLASWGDDSLGEVTGTPSGNDFVAVAAGARWSMALRANGTIVAWGNDFDDQVSDAPTGSGFVGIAAGISHGVAVHSSGSLSAWGFDGGTGKVNQTPTGTDFVAVVTQYDHNSATRANGSLVSWGFNHNGQVTNTPAGSFVAVATGLGHSVAVRSDGSLVSWGNNVICQVACTPAGNDFVAVTAGANWSVALRGDGTLVSWGQNHVGQVTGTPTEDGFIAVSARVNWGVAIEGVQGPLPAPGSLQAVVVSATQVDLAWDDVSGETRYVLQRRSLVEGAWTAWQRIARPNADVTAYSDTELTGWTTYGYRIRACYPAGCSAPTRSPAVVTPGDGTGGPPEAPSSLAAAAVSPTQIDLAWPAVDGATHYVVRRRTRIAGEWGPWETVASVPAGAPAASANGATWQTEVVGFSDTGLSDWTGYRYILFACNAAGCSEPILGAVVITPGDAADIPQAPQSFSAAAISPTQIDLHWDDVEGETHYILLRRTHREGAWDPWERIATPAANATAYSDTEITGGERYRYGLRACRGEACSDRVLSAQVAGAIELAQIDAGGEHTCGLDADGSIVCWGRNNFDQATSPAGSGYTQLSAGGHHNCALRPDGSAICWGRSTWGQFIPPLQGGLTRVGAGLRHSCALDTTGLILCWGSNGFGQSAPPAGSGYTQLSAGRLHSCALAADGSIACWGDNNDGESTPPAGSGYTRVSAGSHFTCALAAGGSIACWGWDEFIGPTPPAGTGFADITAGHGHACALAADGSLVCWGSNSHGQSSPPAGTGFTRVTAGWDHTCARTGDGHVLCWGRNDYGQSTPIR
jgi:alpha-tubulin suppressor-like RCC1 family protein